MKSAGAGNTSSAGMAKVQTVTLSLCARFMLHLKCNSMNLRRLLVCASMSMQDSVAEGMAHAEFESHKRSLLKMSGEYARPAYYE